MSYYRAGKAVYFTNISDAGNSEQVLIADCGNEEKAHTIVEALNNRSQYYIANASRTLSPAWHGDKVAKHLFIGAINNAIAAANALDKFKKTLFYGRDNNLNGSEGQADVSDLPDRMAMPVDASAVNVIHAIIGKFTEAGELLEALKACYNGEAFDRINAIEEVGDGFWYDAILVNEMASDFEDAQARNIAKLRARFPDKFNSVNANERDLAAERAILEDSLTPMQDEGDLLALQATQPVGGKENVEAAEMRADAAFAAANVGNTGVDAPATRSSGKSELAKSPAERLRPLPGEHLAHQPVRPEDLD